MILKYLNKMFSKPIIVDQGMSLDELSPALGGSVSLTQAVNEDDFEVRQKYINQLNLRIPFVIKVVYDPRGEGAYNFFTDYAKCKGYNAEQVNRNLLPLKSEGEFHTRIPLCAMLFQTKDNLPLFIGSKFFSGYTEGEIAQALTYHEGTHVRQISQGFQIKDFDNDKFQKNWHNKKIDSDLVYVVSEFEANFVMLRNIGEKTPVRAEFVEKGKKCFNGSLRYLQQVRGNPRNHTSEELSLANHVLGSMQY